MEKNIADEELLKDKIFAVFFNSLNEPFRQQVYLGQLSDLIFRWCKNYLKFNIDDMGLEIFNITERILRKDNKTNIPKDRDGLIKYLLNALKNGKKEYYRQYEKKNQDDLIRMKESHLGRKLTEGEKIAFTNKWYDYENAMKVIGASLTGNKNDESPHAD